MGRLRTYKGTQILKSLGTFLQYVLDKEVPIYKKIFIIFVFLYLVFPVDFIPDSIFALGIIDDITVLILLFHYYQNELKKYKKKKSSKSKEKENIIENISFTIKDEDQKDINK